MKKKFVKFVRSYRAAGIRPNLFALPQTSLRSENEALTLLDMPLYLVIYICRCVTTIGCCAARNTNEVGTRGSGNFLGS